MVKNVKERRKLKVLYTYLIHFFLTCTNFLSIVQVCNEIGKNVHEKISIVKNVNSVIV